MATPQERIRSVYGFDFPAEFFRFRAFLAELPDGLLADALDMRPAFPFALADGKPATEFPERPLWQDRYYNDLPEFVTLFTGSTDGHHWGYYFDAPGEMPPIVASYWHSDGFEHDIDGEGLFEAVRDVVEHTEASVTEDDPGGEKDYYPGRLEQLALIRAVMRPHWGGDRPETGEDYLETHPGDRWRRTIAPTYDSLDIVMPAKLYERLSANPFVPDKETHRVTLTRPQIEPLVAEALAVLNAGKPGAALKLGRDLWLWADEFPECYDLLDAAYDKLGRGLLRHMLSEARAFRVKCDAGRA